MSDERGTDAKLVRTRWRNGVATFAARSARPLPSAGMASSFFDSLTYPFRALGRALGLTTSKGKSNPSTGDSPGESFWGRLLSGFGWFGGAPGAWSQDRAMQVQQFRGWVYCAVRAIAEEVASQPIQVAYRRDYDQVSDARKAGKAGRYLTKHLRRKALARLQAHEELELVSHKHPLRRLLDNPNPPDTYELFWQKLEINLELTGNGYIWVIPNQLGQPLEMWVLPSHWVWPAERTREQAESGVLIAGYEIRPYGVRAGTGVILPPQEVIHIPLPHPLTPFDGFAPTTAGALWIDTADAVDTARYSAMKQGIWPGVILSLMPEMADPDQSTLDRLRARFKELYQGADKAGKPLVLAPGMEVAQATRAPAEMDFVESSDQLRDLVLTLYRVSKVILGLTVETNRATMEAAIANFLRGCIRPRLRLIDGVLTEKLARRFDENLVVYHEDPTPDNPEHVLAKQELHLAVGVRTLNEVRAEEGMEPYEHGGDNPLIPGSLREVAYGTGQKVDDAPPMANQTPPEEEEDDGEDGSDFDGGANDVGDDGGREADDKTLDRLRRRGVPVQPSTNGGHA